LAGCAAHAILPLGHVLTTCFGLALLASAHAVGWPVAEGGSGAIARALAAHLGALGGEIETGHRVTDLRELPPARAVVFDLAPSAGGGHRGRRAAGHVPPAPAPVPARAERVQGRLRPRRTRALDERSLPAGRHPPRRWVDGRARRGGGRRLARPGARAALRAG